MRGEKMETAKLDNFFQKIFSKREERNVLIDGRKVESRAFLPQDGPRSNRKEKL